MNLSHYLNTIFVLNCLKILNIIRCTTNSYHTRRSRKNQTTSPIAVDRGWKWQITFTLLMALYHASPGLANYCVLWPYYNRCWSQFGHISTITPPFPRVVSCYHGSVCIGSVAMPGWLLMLGIHGSFSWEFKGQIVTGISTFRN